MKNTCSHDAPACRNLVRPLLRFSLLLGLVLTARLSAQPAAPATAGTIEGRVLFAGQPAPKGLLASDTVVYLISSEPKAPSDLGGAGATALLDQRDITYVPHVLPVVAGTKVEIRNSDAILHTVHTKSLLNPAFDRPELAKQTMHVTFAAAEIIPVSCDVHSQMSAYIVVVPTRHFTKAARNGSFRLTDIPAGKYRVVAWHEKYPAVETAIEITAGQSASADINFTSTLTVAQQ